MTISLLFVVLAGFLAQDLIDGRPSSRSDDALRPRPGIFQLLFLGQYAIVALALAISPLAALLTDRTGWHVPLHISMPIALLSLAYFRRRNGATWSHSGPGSHSLFLAALVGIALFRGLHLHSVHGGAIGHDTQQHLFWAEHIDDFGFLPLTSRGSDLLLSYPRLFHLLAASWNALGLFGPIGPWVKIMPFLQSVLACGFFCELLLSARERRDTPRVDLAPILMGLFLCWHLTLGDGQDVYRVGDLSGTPRLASGWLIFGLPLLVLADSVGSFRDARVWIVGLAPALIAASVGVNPSVVGYLVFYSIPLALTIYFVSGGSRGRERPRLRYSLVWGSVASVVLLAANSFVWAQLSSRGLGRSVLHWVGVRTTLGGLPGDTFANPGIGLAGLCKKGIPTCASDLARDSLSAAGTTYWNTLSDGTLPGIIASHQVWYWLTLLVPLAYMAVLASTSERSFTFTPRHARTFLSVLLGSLLAAFTVILCSEVLTRLQVVDPAWALLAGYFRLHTLFLSTWMLCILTTVSWMLLPSATVSIRARAIAMAAAAALTWSELRSFAPPELVNHRNAVQGWSLNWPELRAIKQLNEFVPKHEAVLMMALHQYNGNEHVLFVNSSMGLILPHLETRILFGLSLGSGVDYGWPDLEANFCATTPENRNAFLRRHNARWVLARGVPPTREGYRTFQWPCGVSLKDLSAEFPPAWQERDLTLYRINP